MSDIVNVYIEKLNAELTEAVKRNVLLQAQLQVSEENASRLQTELDAARAAAPREEGKQLLMEGAPAKRGK